MKRIYKTEFVIVNANLTDSKKTEVRNNHTLFPKITNFVEATDYAEAIMLTENEKCKLKAKEDEMGLKFNVVALATKYDTFFMDTHNGHNAELVRVINEMWSFVVYREKMLKIIKLLYNEYRSELAHYYSEECVWQLADRLSFEEMCEYTCVLDVVYELLEHVCDDEDLKTIIYFVRPLTELIKDNYLVTLEQSDNIAHTLLEHFQYKN